MTTRLTQHTHAAVPTALEKTSPGVLAIEVHTQALRQLNKALSQADGGQVGALQGQIHRESNALWATVQAHYGDPKTYTAALAQSLRPLLAPQSAGTSMASHMPQAAYFGLYAVVQHVEEHMLGVFTQDAVRAGNQHALLKPLVQLLTALRRDCLTPAVRLQAQLLEAQLERNLRSGAQTGDIFNPIRQRANEAQPRLAPVPAITIGRGRTMGPTGARGMREPSPRGRREPIKGSSMSNGSTRSSSSSAASSDSSASFGDKAPPLRLASPPTRGRAATRNLPPLGRTLGLGGRPRIASDYVYKPLVRGINFQEKTTLTKDANGSHLEVTAGQKEKYLHAAYSHLRINPKYRFSHLTDFASNQRILMTSTVASGAYGKVRYGIAADGSVVAIKEMRTVFKPGIGVYSRREKTRPIADTQILREAQTTQAMRNIIEEKVSVLDAAQAAEAPLFAGIRKKATPYQTHALIEVRDVTPAQTETSKIHLVMTAELGDMQRLRVDPNLSDNVRHQIALSVAAQGFAELSALHEHGKMGHLDIKLENMFFNGDGQIKLMDFGFAHALDRAGRVPMRGHVGTLLTPEMYTADPKVPTQGMQISSKADVWTMAASVVEMSAPYGMRTLFAGLHGGEGPKRAQLWRANQTSMLQFASWREGLRETPQGAVDLNRIDANDGKWGALFGNLAQNQPALCKLLLERAFESDPERRASAFEIANEVVKLTPKAGSASSEQILGVFKAAEARSSRAELIRNARVYDMWAGSQKK